MDVTFIDGTPIHVPDLEAYWRNPASYDAEIAASRVRCHAAIDVGMARLNAVQAERWAAEGRS